MIQSTTYIHPDAKIAKNVTIGPFTIIENNVNIGEGTWIGPHVTICSGARIGHHCNIFPGAVIAALPQDLKFKGEDSLAIIGDYTTIREYVTISRGTAAGPITQIGSHVLLMAYVHVAHDCTIGNHAILANAVQLAGHVEIGNYVNVGGTAALRQFVKVGDYALISGGSLVRKDVPPFIKVGREPIKYCGLNTVGLSRIGFNSQQIAGIKAMYRYVFQTDLPLQKALECITSELPPCKEKDIFLDFMSRTSLGIIKR